jgi:hypothetical protein
MQLEPVTLQGFQWVVARDDFAALHFAASLRETDRETDLRETAAFAAPDPHELIVCSLFAGPSQTRRKCHPGSTKLCY